MSQDLVASATNDDGMIPDSSDLITSLRHFAPSGTACYFYPNWESGGLYAGILYTLGSCGFLYVDILEFFTFTEEGWLRINIFLSATG